MAETKKTTITVDEVEYTFEDMTLNTTTGLLREPISSQYFI